MDNENPNLSSDPGALILDSALAHVPFDGWSDAALVAAAADSDVTEAQARALFPRGGVDLAAAYHRRGDRLMLARLAEMDLTGLRFRDRIAAAVIARLEVVDKELVRRGTALFALPQNAGEGARLIWGTVDAIWRALGDTSEDVNWYSKRATLAAVYGATVLYWLNDHSEGEADTRAFLSRRIENVMGIEKAKAAFRANPLGRALLGGPFSALSKIRAPRANNLPGSLEP